MKKKTVEQIIQRHFHDEDFEKKIISYGGELCIECANEPEAETATSAIVMRSIIFWNDVIDKFLKFSDF